MHRFTESSIPHRIPNTATQVYTVAESAAQFGRHKSWAYRLISAKRIAVISGFGRMMIPKTEVEKILTSANTDHGHRFAISPSSTAQHS